MRIHFLIVGALLALLPLTACGQTKEIPMDRATCTDEAFDKRVEELLAFSIPVISVETLKEKQQEVVIFDTREREEYNVSHIPGAIYLGYNKLEKKELEKLDKDTPIVVYCSVGYRSEKIGEQLEEMGFTQVENLYGSIFEWVNQGNELVDKKEKATSKIHTYNKDWSQWVEEGAAQKTW